MRCSLYFFSFILTFVLRARASEMPSFETIRARARARHAASDRQWLLLGHWRPGSYGFVSEVDGPDFFFATQGKYDPALELEATLRAFAEPLAPGADESRHAQCRFLARRDWLITTLQITTDEIPLLPCEKISSWKRRLDPDGIAMVFASSYMGNAASMFGHTFLKFHSRANHDDRDLLNYGVNFFAKTGNDGNEAFALFGLIGLYPGFFTMSPYHETLRDYLHLEGRDVWEYRLNFSALETDRLINHLLELQQTYFDYYFIDENCSYQLLAALETARPTLHLTDQFFYAVIPADVVRVVNASPNFVTSRSYRPSLATQFRGSLTSAMEPDHALVRALARGEPAATLANLPLAKRAATLDSAILYAELLRAKDRDDSPAAIERGFKLKMARAQTGITGSAVDDEQTPRALPPEQGHDPARVGFALDQRDGLMATDLQFRFAYHDLLADDGGYLPDSGLEILRFALRHDLSAERSPPPARLIDFTLVDLISTAPIDGFFHPLSWRGVVGYQQLLDQPAVVDPGLVLAGGPGLTFRLLTTARHRLTWMSFAQLHAETSTGLTQRYRLGTSAQTQLLYHEGRWLRANISVETRSYFAGQIGAWPGLWAALSFSLNRDLELQLRRSQFDQISDAAAVLNWHFLL